MSEAWLRSLEKESERYSCRVEVFIEQRSTRELQISRQLSVVCVLYLISI